MREIDLEKVPAVWLHLHCSETTVSLRTERSMRSACYPTCRRPREALGGRVRGPLHRDTHHRRSPVLLSEGSLTRGDLIIRQKSPYVRDPSPPEMEAEQVQIPDSQPPIPTFARRGRLKWTIPASRTQWISSKSLIFLPVVGVSATFCSRSFHPIRCGVLWENDARCGDGLL